MMAAIGPSSEVQNESQIEFTGVSAFTVDSQILHLNHIPRLPVSECGRGSLAACMGTMQANVWPQDSTLQNLSNIILV